MPFGWRLSYAPMAAPRADRLRRKAYENALRSWRLRAPAAPPRPSKSRHRRPGQRGPVPRGRELGRIAAEGPFSGATRAGRGHPRAAGRSMGQGTGEGAHSPRAPIPNCRICRPHLLGSHCVRGIRRVSQQKPCLISRLHWWRLRTQLRVHESIRLLAEFVAGELPMTGIRHIARSRAGRVRCMLPAPTGPKRYLRVCRPPSASCD
jgi:hypothetical protein